MAEPYIVVENLSFIYPDGRQALEEIQFTVEEGEKVALVGPNGAGKSTLLLLLDGILTEGKRGRILIAGRELTRANLQAIRAQVGLLFQNPDDQLFSLTVFDDVAYGPLYGGLPAEEVARRVRKALAFVGLTGFEARMPHHLSLGERKRAALATILAMEPPILALDEPTAGLDPRARRELIALLKSLPCTMLVATHDMRLVWELCPRTLILDGGHLVADGPTSLLLQDAPLMQQHGLETPFYSAAEPALTAQAPKD